MELINVNPVQSEIKFKQINTGDFEGNGYLARKDIIIPTQEGYISDQIKSVFRFEEKSTVVINAGVGLSLHEYVSTVRHLLKPKGNELIAGSVRNHVQRVLQEIQGINPMIRNAQQIRGSVIINWLKKHSKRQVQYMAGHKYISSTEKYEQQEIDSLKDVLAKHHPFG